MSAILEIQTNGPGLYEFTDRLHEHAAGDGVMTIFVRHTSCSLLVQENADPDVRTDLDRFMARLVPDGDALFEHTAEGPDDMPAHVRAILTNMDLTVPVANGKCALGTWQGIYLFEHRNAPHRREVAALLR